MRKLVLFSTMILMIFGLIGTTWAEESGELWPENQPNMTSMDILDSLYKSGAMDQETYNKAKEDMGKQVSFDIKPTAELLVAFTPWNEMPYDEIITYPGGPDKERGFALRKAAFGFKGNLLYDWLTFKLNAQAEPDDEGKLLFGLENAFLNVNWAPKSMMGSNFVPYHGFTLGAMKVPFSRQSLTSEYKLQTINRAMVIDELDIRRDVGMTVDAKYNLFDETAVISLRGGAFNGQGNKNYSTDNNDNLMYTGRIRVDLLSEMDHNEGDLRSTFMDDEGIMTMLSVKGPQISFGASILQNNDIDQIVKAFGMDAEFRWFGLSLLYEYVASKYEPDLGETIVSDTIADEWETHGWYLQGGFFAWPQHLECVIRYEEYTMDLLTDNMDNRVLANTTYGLNFHFATKNRLKLMANYIQREELEGIPELDNDSFTLQGQIAF